MNNIDEAIERAARAMAKAHCCDFDEVCGVDADPDEGFCDSHTCVAAFFDEHDADMARTGYRSQARVAISAFLEDVPVSDEARVLASASLHKQAELGIEDEEPFVILNVPTFYKAMSAALAEELRNGR